VKEGYKKVEFYLHKGYVDDVGDNRNRDKI